MNNYEEWMKFINRNWKKRVVDVIKLGPSYYDNNLEYQELLRNENYLASMFNSSIDKWFLNQFVYSADSDGLDIFETELEMTHLPSASLKERRLAIINRMGTSSNYLSFAWLHSQFRHILEDDEFSLEMDYNNYLLKMVINRMPYSVVSLCVDLRREVPSNITIDIYFDKKPEPEHNYFGIVKAKFGSKTIRQEGT